MPRKVTCSNPDCNAVFQAADSCEGGKVPCPRCGTPTSAGDTFAAFPDRPTLPAGNQENGQRQHHPGRLTCSNCGAVLGVRDAFCPSCGADVRTGQAVLAQEAKKKLNLKPIILGAVGVVVAIVVVIVVMKAVGGKGDEPAGDGDGQVAQQPVPDDAMQPPPAQERQGQPGPGPDAGPGGGRPQPTPEAEPPKPSFELPAQVQAALQSAAQEADQAAAQYRDRLRATLESLPTAGAADAAKAWTDLYTYCKDEGLAAEADLCWYRAASLQPTDSNVLNTLGLTERYKGAPVTLDQKAFLESLNPVLKVRNLNPDFGAHRLRVGEQTDDFPLGGEVKVNVEPGPVLVEVVSAGTSERTVAAFRMEAEPCVVYSIDMQSVSSAGTLPFDELSSLYGAVQSGMSSEEIAIRRNAEGALLGLTGTQLSLRGTSEEPLDMQLPSPGELRIAGTIARGNRFSDDGQQVVAGSGRQAVRLALDGAARTITVQAGAVYTLHADFAEGMWGVLATAQGDLASEWFRRRLARKVRAADLKNTSLEADGELLGAWQADIRMRDELDPLVKEIEEQRTNLQRAAAAAPGIDNVRALNLEDRTRSLYLNWPRFRDALALATSGMSDALMDCLDSMSGGTGVSSRRSLRGRRGSGFGAGVRQQDQLAAAARMEMIGGTEAELLPEPVELNDDQQTAALMNVLGILSEDEALQIVTERWEDMPPGSRVAAMISLEKIAGSRVVDYLGELSKDPANPQQAAMAMLSLGVIGTPQALEYCRGLAIAPEVRAASMVARVAGGDIEAVDELAGFIQGAEADVQSNVITFLTDNVSTASTLLGLTEAASQFQDEDSVKRLMLSFARLGGKSGISGMATLTDRAGQEYAEALALVDADLATILAGPLSRQLRGGGGVASARLLMRNGSPEAMAVLQAAAASGNGDVVNALLAEGGAENIEAAAAGSRTITEATLRALKQQWYQVDMGTGEPAWEPGVEPLAARYFLEQSLANAGGLKARLVAAEMLREIGRQPDPEALIAVATAPMAEESDGRSRFRRSRVGTQYTPPGFKEWEDVPAYQGDLQFPGIAQVYALRMLGKVGDASTAARLKEVADTFEKAQLKAEALKAMAVLDAGPYLDDLRTMATARTDSYSDVSEIIAELETRMAALPALGAAQDASFLPQVVAMLQERAPEPGRAVGPEGDPEALKGWWEAKLRTSACRCIAAMCRERTAAQLTGDSALEQTLVQLLVNSLQTPAADRGVLFNAAVKLRAEAVRAFGRAAPPNEQNTAIVEQLALQLAESDGGRRSRRAMANARTAQVMGAEAERLRGPVVDAAAFMLARNGNAAGLQEALKGLVESETEEADNLDVAAVELAGTPAASYVEFLTEFFDKIAPPVRQQILASLRESGPESEEYVRWAVALVAGPPVERAVEEITVATTREGGSRRETASERQRRIAAEVRAADLALEREMAAGVMGGPGGGPPPGLEPLPDAPARRGSRRRAPAGARTTGDYSRSSERSFLEWSYSMDALREKAAQAEEKWQLARHLFEAAPGTVSGVLEGRGFLESDFSPAVAALYTQTQSSARGDVIALLGDGLLEEPGEVGGVSRMRSMVAAIRRIGGDPAAEALYTALVGPVPEAAPTTMTVGPDGLPMGPGMRGMPPSMRGMPGMAGAATDRGDVASFVARALGSMGRADLLKQALTAQGREYYDANAGEVQIAALGGLAFLPDSGQAVKELQTLQRQAGTPPLRAACAKAILTALRAPAQ